MLVRFLLFVSVMLGVLACGGGDDAGSEGSTTPKDASPDTSATDAGKDATADVGHDAMQQDGGPAECEPKTCALLEANCGSAPDGCGGKITCGECPDGQTCGGGGTNVCGTDECTPKSCVQVSAQCGWASDGCADAVDCGACAVPEVCGGGGELNACGCSPKSCSQLGVNCGTLPDGCLGTVDCGSCSGGQACGGGGPNVCGASECVPKTCAQLGVSCGFVSDGCSQALDCGECTGPEVCGGGGQLNQCGCTAKSCSQLGASCGTIDTGCGDVDCGDCSPPDSCGGAGVENQCGCTCTLPNATTSCLAGVCSITACDTGWDNCDSVTDNGCELHLSVDPANCGQCGLSCSFANASAVCSGGTCQLDQCNKGFADCNGVADDGCEINLQTDVTHCGSCSDACSLAHAQPGCSNGSCTITSCDSGWGDCNGSVSDGCEINTNTNPTYCGSCDNACSVPNAASGCSSGTCTIASCDPGWQDCDGLISNGCEANMAGDPTNCGGCGTVCNGTNGTPLCQSGICAIACNSGYGNCDGSLLNGCEVNTAADIFNCGSCGNNCTNPVPADTESVTCSSGSCTVSTCTALYYDQNGTFTDGCECLSDAIPNTCGSAAGLGTFYTSTTVKPSTTMYYNLVPTGDTDYFYGSWYIYSSSCNYRPRVELLDTSNLLRMRVYTNTTCTTGYACNSTETGTSTKGIRTWDFGHSAPCGGNASIDPSPAIGSYFTLPTTFRIEVYSTSASPSCLPYQLRFSRY